MSRYLSAAKDLGMPEVTYPFDDPFNYPQV